MNSERYSNRFSFWAFETIAFLPEEKERLLTWQEIEMVCLLLFTSDHVLLEGCTHVQVVYPPIERVYHVV